MSRTAFLVGANRGIGLELARTLAVNNWTVFASVRPETRAAQDPSIAEVDNEPVSSSSLCHCIRHLEIDLLNESTIQAAAQKFGDRPLDVLINLAGMDSNVRRMVVFLCFILLFWYPANPWWRALGIGPEPDNWYEHTAEILMDKYATNTVGPFLVCKHFHPNVKLAKGIIINISSLAASIGCVDVLGIGCRHETQGMGNVVEALIDLGRIIGRHPEHGIKLGVSRKGIVYGDLRLANAAKTTEREGMKAAPVRREQLSVNLRKDVGAANKFVVWFDRASHVAGHLGYADDVFETRRTI
ncbi:uncharacterized protein SPSK_10461 [Sporothrix schenckii 1099-18]|uniref:Uncharacterized protein n=1 Tax=Sporothrix schenckii 1099-18 TaxID=1397361 RepID=A0A0F2MCG1_SPOSC|nr:uncharacterized protein SPSK_10461 [Sporothrix schenckii 1099-18]KJR86764.1 hypothetical protein SPSK_10461 [Sporothrix schenckii 1099-18]